MVNTTGNIELIAGCRVDKLIHQGVNSLVYTGQRDQGDPKAVILKVLAQEFPTPKKVARFQFEFQLIKELQASGVIGCYDLKFDAQLNRWVMLLEDFHAESLDRLKPFEADDGFYKIAQRMVNAIDQVHRQHVVHKDINPSNIVMNRVNGQIKLIDFGISSRVPRAAHVPANRFRLEGTLAYMSPEQSGRTGRSISYQSDYYSLGVTFFQLLTGKLPFVADDVLEMVHSHVAKPAPDPREFVPELPRALSEVVLKLLSKNAEDRHQSAFELQTDLENCLHNRPVSIHRKPSVPSEFRLPQKLYGREQESELLLEAFERVSRGTSEVVLVGGYTGVGKSTLVRDVYRAIAQHRGYFIDGKFDQLQKSVPYAALLQAFKALLKQILAQPDDNVNDWRLKLLNRLGGNAQLIIAALPELELIIGKQPVVEELPPHEARNRFVLTFQNFVKVFAKPEHPLVIFLDDLQWVDAGSLQLLEGLLTYDAEIALYLIGAYRDSETGPEHPLNVSARTIEQAGVTLTRLQLAPLPVDQVELLISDTTGAEADAVSGLTHFVYARTEGNPFFINQILQSLYMDGLFQFDPARGRWDWQQEQVQSYPVSDDISTLMERKIGQLPKEACRALSLAACIGNRFRLHTLAVLYDSTEQDVAKYLWPAVDAGLVFTMDDSYQLLQLNVPGLGKEVGAEYRFAHDQIQQAAYAIISDAEKPVLHQRLGELLRLDSPDSFSFEAIDQLNLGRSLIENQAQRDELAEANLQAGRLAKSAPAYSAAQAYFEIGLDLLDGDSKGAPDKCWSRQYDLSLALHTDAAESAYLNDDSTQTEKLAAAVQQHAADLLDKIKIYEIQIQAAIASNRLPEAIEIGLSALQLLDINFPAKPGKAGVMADFVKTKLALAGKKPEQLADLPLVDDPLKLAQRRVLRSITTPAFFTAPNLFPLLIFEQVRRSVKEGTTPESAYAYMLYGVSLCGVAGDIENGYRFGKLALQLAERFNNGELTAKVVYGHYLFIEPWKNHINTTFAPFQKAYQGALESGDTEFASYLLYIRPVFGYAVGESLSELAVQMAESSSAISALKQQRAKRTLSFRHQAILNLLGETGTDSIPNADPGVLTGHVCDEAELLAQYEAAQDRNGIAELHLNKLMLHYLFENYTAANKAANNIAPHLDTLIGLVWTAVYHFYRGLTQAALATDLTGSSRRRALAVVSSSEKKLKGWSKYSPDNFLHKYHLLAAERARVKGNYSQAQAHYEHAIEASQDSGYVNEMAMAYELAAKFYFANNQAQLGAYHLRDAHYAYLRWGASRKLEALEKQYPLILVEAKTYRQSDANILSRSITSSADRLSTSLDFASVLKAMQVISSEIMLDPLLEKLLTIVIENVGAQRGVLLLPHHGSWQVAATGEVSAEGAVAASTEDNSDIADGKISNLLPETVITYVARSGELIVLDSNDSNDLFSRDPYIAKSKPRSALCAPLQQQGKLVGIIYLENHLTRGVFSTERLRVLELVLVQAAISIENASLYTRQSKSAEAARRFVPLEFLRLIGKENIEDTRLGDQVQLDMTVMFFDIRSFTTMSEHMTPQQNFDFVNSYFEKVCPIIREHSGFVVKFGGDGIMAAFPKRAEDAIDTAVAVLKLLQSYEALHTRDTERNLRVGFGVHAGSMMPGIVGEAERLQCDILSDVVNVSARLEALTKKYGANVLVSKEVLSRLEATDVYRVRRLGQTVLQGREQYSEVFEVCDGDSQQQQQLKMQTRDRFDIGVGLYNENRYAEASVHFNDVLSSNPDDKAARLYLEQSASLMIKPSGG